MKYSDESYNLRIELDTRHCRLTEQDLAHLERGLDPLREPVRKFPVADLYATIEWHPRSHQYRVKTALRLPGRGLATGDLDSHFYPAFERCVRKLVKKVTAYEHQMSDKEDRVKHVKGTRHDVSPQDTLDIGQLRDDVAQGDYAGFRRRLFPYEESVRKRAGRWIGRYPDLERQLGDRFDLADLVEEVFLNAFERFDERSQAVPFGEWLEGLIDPSLKLLGNATEAELENISFARTLHELD